MDRQGRIAAWCCGHARWYPRNSSTLLRVVPENLLWVEDPATKDRVRVVPGELRRRDVRVGTHVAVSPGALPRFLERFCEVYGKLGKAEAIISTAAAHHRLLWMHPFIDGN